MFSLSLTQKLKTLYNLQNTLPKLIDDSSIPEQTLEDYYVKLHILLENQKIDKRSIEIAQLFSAVEDQGQVGKVIITGVAGVGKTTLLNYISYEWGKGRLFQNEFDYIFKIKLKILLDNYLCEKIARTEKNHRIALLIQSSLEQEQYAQTAKTNLDNTAQILHSTLTLEEIANVNKQKVLLLLDGYDEIEHLMRGTHIAREIMHRICDYDNVIISTRPNAISSYIENRFERKIENVGIGSHGAQEYIKKYFQKKSDSLIIEINNFKENNISENSKIELFRYYEQSTTIKNKAYLSHFELIDRHRDLDEDLNEFQAFIEIYHTELEKALLDLYHNNPLLQATLSIPINVAMICLISSDEEILNQFKENFNLSQLYHGVILWLSKRYLIKFKGMNYLDITYNRAASLEELNILKYIAHEKFKLNEVVISGNELDHVAHSFKEELTIREVNKFGLLKSQHINQIHTLELALYGEPNINKMKNNTIYLYSHENQLYYCLKKDNALECTLIPEDGAPDSPREILRKLFHRKSRQLSVNEELIITRWFSLQGYVVFYSTLTKAAELESRDLIRRTHAFVHLSFQEYLTAYQLKELLQSNDLTLIKKTTQFIGEQRNSSRYLLMLKFLAGLVTHDTSPHAEISLIRFWQAIICDIDGVIEIGNNAKITLLMHLLEQAKIDGEFDYRIPYIQDLENFIDSVILGDNGQNIIAWAKPLKESHYLSKNVINFLLKQLELYSDENSGDKYKSYLKNEFIIVQTSKIIELVTHFHYRIGITVIIDHFLRILNTDHPSEAICYATVYAIATIANLLNHDVISPQKIKMLIKTLLPFMQKESFKNGVIAIFDHILKIDKQYQAMLEEKMIILIKNNVHSNLNEFIYAFEVITYFSSAASIDEVMQMLLMRAGEDDLSLRLESKQIIEHCILNAPNNQLLLIIDSLFSKLIPNNAFIQQAAHEALGIALHKAASLREDLSHINTILVNENDDIYSELQLSAALKYCEMLPDRMITQAIKHLISLLPLATTMKQRMTLTAIDKLYQKTTPALALSILEVYLHTLNILSNEQRSDIQLFMENIALFLIRNNSNLLIDFLLNNLNNENGNTKALYAIIKMAYSIALENIATENLKFLQLIINHIQTIDLSYISLRTAVRIISTLSSMDLNETISKMITDVLTLPDEMFVMEDIVFLVKIIDGNYSNKILSLLKYGLSNYFVYDQELLLEIIDTTANTFNEIQIFELISSMLSSQHRLDIFKKTYFINSSREQYIDKYYTLFKKSFSKLFNLLSISKAKSILQTLIAELFYQDLELQKMTVNILESVSDISIIQDMEIVKKLTDLLKKSDENLEFYISKALYAYGPLINQEARNTLLSELLLHIAEKPDWNSGSHYTQEKRYIDDYTYRRAVHQTIQLVAQLFKFASEESKANAVQKLEQAWQQEEVGFTTIKTLAFVINDIPSSACSALCNIIDTKHFMKKFLLISEILTHHNTWPTYITIQPLEYITQLLYAERGDEGVFDNTQQTKKLYLIRRLLLNMKNIHLEELLNGLYDYYEKIEKDFITEEAQHNDLDIKHFYPLILCDTIDTIAFIVTFFPLDNQQISRSLSFFSLKTRDKILSLRRLLYQTYVVSFSATEALITIAHKISDDELENVLMILSELEFFKPQEDNNSAIFYMTFAQQVDKRKDLVNQLLRQLSIFQLLKILKVDNDLINQQAMHHSTLKLKDPSIYLELMNDWQNAIVILLSIIGHSSVNIAQNKKLLQESAIYALYAILTPLDNQKINWLNHNIDVLITLSSETYKIFLTIIQCLLSEETIERYTYEFIANIITKFNITFSIQRCIIHIESVYTYKVLIGNNSYTLKDSFQDDFLSIIFEKLLFNQTNVHQAWLNNPGTNLKISAHAIEKISSIIFIEEELNNASWKPSLWFLSNQHKSSPSDIFFLLERRDEFGCYQARKVKLYTDKNEETLLTCHPNMIDFSFRKNIFGEMRYSLDSLTRPRYFAIPFSDIAYHTGIKLSQFKNTSLLNNYAIAQAIIQQFLCNEPIYNIFEWPECSMHAVEFKKAQLLQLSEDSNISEIQNTARWTRSDSFQISMIEFKSEMDMIKERLSNINFDHLADLLEHKAEQHADQNIFEEFDECQKNFYKSLVLQLNAMHVAALAIHSQVIDLNNQQQGITGKLGGFFQTISSHIPMIGLGIKTLGAIMVQVDSNNQLEAIFKYAEQAPTSSDMEYIAKKIALILAQNFTIIEMRKDFLSEFCKATELMNQGATAFQTTYQMVNAFKNLNPMTVFNALDIVNLAANTICSIKSRIDAVEQASNDGQKPSNTTEYAKQLLFGVPQSDSDTAIALGQAKANEVAAFIIKSVFEGKIYFSNTSVSKITALFMIDSATTSLKVKVKPNNASASSSILFKPETKVYPEDKTPTNTKSGASCLIQ